MLPVEFFYLSKQAISGWPRTAVGLALPKRLREGAAIFLVKRSFDRSKECLWGFRGKAPGKNSILKGVFLEKQEEKIAYLN